MSKENAYPQLNKAQSLPVQSTSYANQPNLNATHTAAAPNNDPNNDPTNTTNENPNASHHVSIAPPLQHAATVSNLHSHSESTSSTQCKPSPHTVLTAIHHVMDADQQYLQQKQAAKHLQRSKTQADLAADHAQFKQKYGMWSGFVRAGQMALSVIDTTGEFLADLLGITDSKYQNVIDAHNRELRMQDMEREAAEEARKKQEMNRDPHDRLERGNAYFVGEHANENKTHANPDETKRFSEFTMSDMKNTSELSRQYASARRASNSKSKSQTRTIHVMPKATQRVSDAFASEGSEESPKEEVHAMGEWLNDADTENVPSDTVKEGKQMQLA